MIMIMIVMIVMMEVMIIVMIISRRRHNGNHDNYHELGELVANFFWIVLPSIPTPLFLES